METNNWKIQLGNIIDTGSALIGEKRYIKERLMVELDTMYENMKKNNYSDYQDFCDNVTRLGDLLYGNDNFNNAEDWELIKVNYDDTMFNKFTCNMLEEKEN